MRSLPWASLWVVLFGIVSAAPAADGNRLTYLDESDPYYVARTFPRLVTPQWVGEEGVEAVVILAIDDMWGVEKYETYLRPILRRLQQIDGRAPVSIMTNRIDPDHPHLQTWLKAGLSLETHTFHHPCPLLQGGDFDKAKQTYDRCIDLLQAVPNNRPVAFRMPCCDSMNSPSPRFYAEIFNKVTATTPPQFPDKNAPSKKTAGNEKMLEKVKNWGGNFLTIDSSVLNIITANDPELPRPLVVDADGREKFRKYLPAGRTFVNTIEDYPYPYVIGRLCWEFPCVLPSDWEAQHYHKPNNPRTVEDWKAALDATVVKRGVFTMIFHPLGWIMAEQVNELIEHATAKHGKKVKFLTFKEAQERLDKHLLNGQPLRDAKGQDNGVRLLDVNNDGYLDVVIGNDKVRQTRVWSPATRTWKTVAFPVPLTRADEGAAPGDQPAAPARNPLAAPRAGERVATNVRFGVVRQDGHASCFVGNRGGFTAWHFHDEGWIEDRSTLSGKDLLKNGLEHGARFRDLDRDGCCELIVGNGQQQAIFAWSVEKKAWRQAPFALPAGTTLATAEGKDAGLRFVDIDEDGFDDVVFSNEEKYGVYLFQSMKEGWSRKVKEGKAGDKNGLPMIARKGSNNGVWFHSRSLWAQNESTNLLKDSVARLSFNEMLTHVEPAAKSPAAALKSMQVRPGFVVEQVAAEPLVQDPIAFAWGPDAKLWVVEMGDYPLGIGGTARLPGKPGGKIKFLEDRDGDGVYDKATVFLEGLSFPTSVLPWRKGVLITCAPHILYAEDADGDGKADDKVVLFSGFTEGNQQHRVNSLAWGLDNWIHCANGDSGGKVKSRKTGVEANLSGRDLRIRPDTGALDLQSGQAQYGRNRDDWDNWFGNNNANPMWHYALADHYIRRNPHLAAPDPRVMVSVTPGAAAVFPISRTLPRFNNPDTANHFTSACSAIVYRDDLFGPAFLNNTFVCEPVHNLVHREIMTPTGTTFTSRRAADEHHAEFLASSDNWFRPTSLQTGPDGALWVADMYRQVIEHPQWIPREWQERLDLRAGHDRGRLYRVYPVGQKPRAIPRLDRLDTAGLVAALDSPSGWQRDLAQMMLLWRHDKSAVPLLEKQAVASQKPLCRLHSLCTLEGLQALQPTLLRQALADTSAGVRRHAIRLCETHLNRSPELGTLLVRMVDDVDPQVRLQLAYTLGEWDDVRAGTALGQLALRDAGDRYLAAAVMSSIHKQNLDAVLLAVLATPRQTPPASLVENLLRLANALNHKKALGTLLAALARPDQGRFTAWHFTALAGLLDTLDQRNTPLSQLGDGDDDIQAALKKLTPLFDAARARLASKDAPREEPLLALRLLGRGLDHQQEDISTLAALLVPQTADDLQGAAIAGLGRLRDPRVPDVLVQGWKGYGPTLRLQVLDVLLRRDDWVKATLDAIERKLIAPAEIDATRRQRLLEHKDVGLRHRVAQLFADVVSPDRRKVIDAYQAVLQLKGDPARGVHIFTKNCATCHKLGDVGHIVGPDLASLADKSPSALLIAVLDPNRAVEARYLNYTAILHNGLSHSGVLAAETGNSITLLAPDGKQQIILRKDLDELASTGKSAMPEGLEKDIKPQDLADLFAHIRSTSQPKPKTFAGNKPELVRPAGDGSLLLSASTAEIHGASLAFEKKHGNLGYWNSDDDRAVWSVDVPKTGTYAVWLDWACSPSSAGKPFVLQAGLNQLTGKITSTDNWNAYKQEKVGTIVLSAGTQKLILRAAAKLDASALMDFKSLRLVPAAE